MIKDLSAKLIAAAAEINKKSYESYHAEQRALQEKLAAKQIKMPAAPVPKADPAAVSTSKKMAEEAETIEEVEPIDENSALDEKLDPKQRAMKSAYKANMHTNTSHRITSKNVSQHPSVSQPDLSAKGTKSAYDKAAKDTDASARAHANAHLSADLKAQKDNGNAFSKAINKHGSAAQKFARKPSLRGPVGKLPEEVEQTQEAMGHAATVTMKHVMKSNATPTVKAAIKKHAPDIKSYADRAAALNAAGIKREEVELTQEGWDDMMKASQAKAGEEKAAKGTGKFNKKVVSTGTVYTRKASTFDDGTGKDSDERRQDRERRKAMKEGLMATMRRISKKVIDTVGHKDDTDLIKGMQKQAGVPQTGKKPVAENMDTPGNSTHQCAIHVKSEQFGEGRCLTTQHAEPVDGFVEWYDVMFAEGIKRVNVADVEVLEAMSHGNHTKKKAK